MLNKSSSTFRIFLSSCHPEQARPIPQSGKGGRSRRIPIYFLYHSASGSSHKTLLNSFASIAPFAVKFQISLAGSWLSAQFVWLLLSDDPILGEEGRQTWM